MDIYNSHSIKARIAITKQNRQGYLFMPREVITDKRLNSIIESSEKTAQDNSYRIPYFRKNPCYGSQIFVCLSCGKERIYGQALSEPERTLVFILCEGTCKKNTSHRFDRVHRGREERIFA